MLGVKAQLLVNKSTVSLDLGRKHFRFFILKKLKSFELENCTFRCLKNMFSEPPDLVCVYNNKI